MSLIAPDPFLILEIEVGTQIDIGAGRRCIPILGGRVAGAIEGEIMPGADWQTMHDNGDLEIAAHYAFRTANGAVVEVQSNGVRAAPAGVHKKLSAGEPVEPSAYYFRTFIRFCTGAPELSYLNSRLFVSRGERHSSRVRLEIFEVL